MALSQCLGQKARTPLLMDLEDGSTIILAVARKHGRRETQYQKTVICR